ncbi:MAG: PAS domain-containing protein, partial [Daejeonella sp.]|nr:PAS domain-containing protein [Daejeonella sp.]
MNNSILLEVFKSSPVPVLLIRREMSGYAVFNGNVSFAEQFNLSENEIHNIDLSTLYQLMTLPNKDIKSIYDSLSLIPGTAQKEKSRTDFLKKHDGFLIQGQYYDVEQIPIYLVKKAELYILQYWHKQVASNPEISDQNPSKDDYTGLQLKYELVETILANLPIGIAVNKIDTGEATLVNPQFSKIYGWSSADLSDIETFFKRVYPDDFYRKQMFNSVMSDLNSGI